MTFLLTQCVMITRAKDACDCDHTDTHAIWSLDLCCSDIQTLCGCLIIIFLLFLDSGQTETFKMLQKLYLQWLLCCDVAVIMWVILSLPKSPNQAWWCSATLLKRWLYTYHKFPYAWKLLITNKWVTESLIHSHFTFNFKLVLSYTKCTCKIIWTNCMHE